MRNSLRLAIMGVIASASFVSSAQAATTATGTATAEILSSLTVTPVADLRFGQIAANTGGTVTVNADGSVASTGTLIATGTTTTRGPAQFDVVGSPSASVIVTLPAAAVNLTRSGGTETMTLSNFNTNPVGALQLNATGNGSFMVGGRLLVASGQMPGNYSGTFQVSVEYQ